MELSLPPKTYNLIQRYANLKIGPHKVACPYYQNIKGRRNKAVYLGKGLPGEIEHEVKHLFRKNGKDLNKYEPASIRLYMANAGLGIDCSGFVTRIIQSLLNEKHVGSLTKSLKPQSSSPLSLLRHTLRPHTNLSADTLTNLVNCIKVRSINDVLPGDLLRLGQSHLAIVTKIEKSGTKINKIIYYHSTSDYLEKHGVRKGSILITKPGGPLEKEKWDENHQGRNWMLEDYINAKKNNRGFRRLKALSGKS
jgi:hypothetical protein